MADIGASTRDGINDALISLIRLDAKQMRGERLADEESHQYVASALLVSTFSGAVIATAFRLLFCHPTGQRVLASALPPVFAVTINPHNGLTVQEFERDAEGEITRVVSRPLAC